MPNTLYEITIKNTEKDGSLYEISIGLRSRKKIHYIDSQEELLKKFGKVICSEVFGEINLTNTIVEEIKPEILEGLEQIVKVNNTRYKEIFELQNKMKDDDFKKRFSSGFIENKKFF